jgi:CubicO group peptidase (beta-lactamase class C family)
MNYLQVQQLSWSARQWTYAKRAYSRPRVNQLRLLVGVSLIILEGLFLLLALLLAAWSTTHHNHATPYAQNSTFSSQVTVRTQNPKHAIQATSTSLSPTPIKKTTPLTPLPQPSTINDQLDTFLTTQVATDQFSGSVLIARNGKVLFSNGYSMADWAHQVPNTPHTKFHIGSLTKQFTAMAIMILQERGKVHVQDALCTYIPNCPTAWQPVTIQELLTHTSGIPQLDSPQPTSSPQDWFARYNNVNLAFAAGAQFSYCNVCYQILGYVVQQVSGEPYSEFVQQAIFNRLQMRNTGFDPNYLSLPDRAVGYQDWQVKADPDDLPLPPEMSFLYASGLLYSTIQDLYRWDQALSQHTLVSQQSQEAIFTPYVSSCPQNGPEEFCPDFSSLEYGYGWFIATESTPTSQRQVIWHYGALDGFTAYIGRYLDDKVTIIVLSNLQKLDVFALVSKLEQIVLTGH